MNFRLNSIPPFIVDKHRKNITHGCFRGSVLFVDISGFTSLTEKLLGKGERGVEEISKIIFRVFDPQIEAVFESGGFVSYFAGDAFMAVFENDSGERAFCAEKKIRKWFDTQYITSSSDKDRRLDVHFSRGRGNIEWGIYNTLKRKMFYLKGEAFDRAFFETAYKGVFGDINNHPISFSEFSKIKTDDYILDLYEEKEVVKTSSCPEIRDIVSIFLQLKGFQTHEEISAIGAFTSEKAASFGGILNKLIFCDKGLTALVFFGAPLALESPEEKALSFASKFRDKSKSIFPDKRWRGGITRGQVFVGLTGGRRCNEWTALGDSVNTASRLMSLSSWGNVTVSEKIVKKSNAYSFTYAGLAELKGKESAAPIFFFEGQTEKIPEGKKTPFINREREKKWLQSCLIPPVEGKFGGLNCLTGESGLGKTRLIDEVRKESSLEWINLFCKGHLNKAFYPVTMWMRTYFELSDGDDLASFRAKLGRVFNQRRAGLEEIGEEVIFLASLADIRIEDEILKETEPKFRVEKQIFSFKSLLKILSENNPLVVFIDDMQFSDEFTAELIASLSKNTESIPMTVIISVWPNYFEKNETFKPVKFNSDFVMKGIPDEEIYRAIVKRITDTEPTGKFIALLREKAKNVPLFCEQLVLHLKETNSLFKSPDGRCAVKEEDLKIPSEIGDLLTSRLDRLDVDLREALKHASVLGLQFEESVFRNLIFNSNSFGSDMNKDYLHRAKEEGLIEEILGDIEGHWFFRSPILRDISYNLQLPSVRGELHGIAAESINLIHADNIAPYYDDLIYHYREAGETEKEIRLLNYGAQRAEQRYENRKAVSYYLRYAELISQKCSPDVEAELFRVFKKTGYIYSIIGDYQTALGYYEKALSPALFSGESHKIADVSIAMGDLYKNTGDYESAVKTLEKAMEHAEKIGNEPLLGEIYNTLGMTELDLSDFEKAHVYFRRALEMSEKSGDIKLKTLISTNIGLLYNQEDFSLYDTDKAVEYSLKALELSSEIDSKRIKVNILNNLAIIYAQKGDFQKAKDFFEKLLALLESIGDFNRKGIVNNNFAYLFAEFLNDKDKAAGHYIKSFDCYEEISDEYMKISTFMSVLELVLAEKLKEYLDWISRKIHYLCFSEKIKFTEDEIVKFKNTAMILRKSDDLPQVTKNLVFSLLDKILAV